MRSELQKTFFEGLIAAVKNNSIPSSSSKDLQQKLGAMLAVCMMKTLLRSSIHEGIQHHDLHICDNA